MDNNATTPVLPEVLQAMVPFFTEQYGNSSSDHLFGLDAAAAVSCARESVVQAINGKDPRSVIFTSGATEANNIALIGAANGLVGKERHFIVSSIEHSSILSSCRVLESQGSQITYLPVDVAGRVSLDTLRQCIRKDTVLASVMLANNEIGTINDVQAIGEILRRHNILFHCDAAQALGSTKIDVARMNIDLLTLSAHKFYGPKGIGVLWIRPGAPRVNLTPLVHGGGQERGIRAGTLNVPGAVGLGKAIEIAVNCMDQSEKMLRNLRDFMWDSLRREIQGIQLNGHPVYRLANNLNIFIPGVDAKALALRLRETVAFSAGSACHSGSNEPSHVILALGHPPERARSSLRFGIGKKTTKEDVEQVVAALVSSARFLRALSL